MRYTTRPLPAAPFLPGSGRRPPPYPEPAAPLDPERWWTCKDYLFAVDLFNAGCYWECHEVLEGLWKMASRSTARTLQGLIQVAAGLLRRSPSKVLQGLSKLDPPTLGVVLRGSDPPRISLRIPGRSLI